MTNNDHSATVVKAKEVIGLKVRNQAGDDLGTIIEVVLDKTNGKVAYLALESGAILSIGGKLFALAWGAVRYDSNQECLIANIDKDILANASGFDKNHWPDTADFGLGAVATKEAL